LYKTECVRVDALTDVRKDMTGPWRG